MKQRLSSMSRFQKIAVGLVALLLSCGLCSRCLPETAKRPTNMDQATTVAASAEPVETRPASTETPGATETTIATDTEEATATVEPTTIPTTLVPSTVATVQPTALPAYMSLDPLQDRDCNEFPSQAAAQSYWGFHQTADRPNPGRLDGNGNGIVCEDPDRNARQAPAQEQAAPPPAAPESGCVNFNTAGYDDLRRIMYVDEKIANEILKKRPFSGWDDLVKRVGGIGPNNVKEIQAEGVGCF